MISTIRTLLDPLDSSPTECDGMTRLCHTVLSHHQIAHTVFSGTCHYQDDRVNPHFWIDLDGPRQGWSLDYRLQLWLGNSAHLPHGVFQPHRFPEVLYDGRPIAMQILPEPLFQILLGYPT